MHLIIMLMMITVI